MGTNESRMGKCPFHQGSSAGVPASEEKTGQQIFHIHSHFHRLPVRWRAYSKLIQILREWIFNYVSKPNISLGRKGDVCPFTGKSILQNQFYFSLEECRETNVLSLSAIILGYKALFEKLNIGNSENLQKENIFNAIVVMFPNIAPDNYKRIVSTQSELKATFVNDGFMIGQFFPGCRHPGIHNENFHPLDSPVPLLVIRNMVKTDWLFLKGNPIFEQAYTKLFNVPSDLHS
jgi:hypothetical protein